MKNNCSDFVGCHAFVFGRFKAALQLQRRKARLRWSAEALPQPQQLLRGNRRDLIGRCPTGFQLFNV